MKVALGILGVCLMVIGGLAGTIYTNAKNHHTTWEWEYHRLIADMVPDAVTEWNNGRRADDLKADLNALTVEKKGNLDRVLAHPDSVTRQAPKKPNRVAWYTEVAPQAESAE